MAKPSPVPEVGDESLPCVGEGLLLKEHAARPSFGEEVKTASVQEAMGGSQMPVLATVIPVLNEERFIERCLKSLLNQTLPASQHMILVLDGGSQDGTVAVVERLISEHQGEAWPRLVLEMNPQRTVPHARNLALRMLPKSVEFMVEMIGHATVDADHLEQRLLAWEACEAEVPEGLAGVGVRVVEDGQERTRIGIG